MNKRLASSPHLFLFHWRIAWAFMEDQGYPCIFQIIWLSYSDDILCFVSVVVNFWQCVFDELVRKISRYHRTSSFVHRPKVHALLSPWNDFFYLSWRASGPQMVPLNGKNWGSEAIKREAFVITHMFSTSQELSSPPQKRPNFRS